MTKTRWIALLIVALGTPACLENSGMETMAVGADGSAPSAGGAAGGGMGGASGLGGTSAGSGGTSAGSGGTSAGSGGTSTPPKKDAATLTGTGGKNDAAIPDSQNGQDVGVTDVGSKVEALLVDARIAVDHGDGETGKLCPTITVGPFPARAARSRGYRGTLDAYSGLYRTACTKLADCAAACEAAGGTKDSCELGSECISSFDPPGSKHCLPPTYWRYEDRALAADDDPAEQTMVVIGYQDALVLTDFGVPIPENATVRGLKFDILRNVLDIPSAVDDSVRVLRAGQPVGRDHALGEGWPVTPTYVSYGSADDAWGASLTAADVRNPGFGISVAARYLGTAGNTRAYIDFAQVTVTYSNATCP